MPRFKPMVKKTELRPGTSFNFLAPVRIKHLRTPLQPILAFTDDATLAERMSTPAAFEKITGLEAPKEMFIAFWNTADNPPLENLRTQKGPRPLLMLSTMTIESKGEVYGVFLRLARHEKDDRLEFKDHLTLRNELEDTVVEYQLKTRGRHQKQAIKNMVALQEGLEKVTEERTRLRAGWAAN